MPPGRQREDEIAGLVVAADSTAESLMVGAVVPSVMAGLAVVTIFGLAGLTSVCSAVVP